MQPPKLSKVFKTNSNGKFVIVLPDPDEKNEILTTIGPFLTEKEAEDYCQEIKKINIKLYNESSIMTLDDEQEGLDYIIKNWWKDDDEVNDFQELQDED